MRLHVSVCFLAVLCGAAVAYKSYNGYQVLRTAPLDEVSMSKLVPLMSRPELDFWTRLRLGQPADIMTSPKYAKKLWSELKSLGLNPSVHIPDVGIQVKQERTAIESIKAKESRNGKAPILDRYLTFDEIQAYLDEVAANFPAIATIIDIGTSTEGRPLRVLKLSNGPGKPGIFFDSVMHAREWIGPPVVLYTINELTENLANNQAMLDRNDFYFLPVANPDGYAYTWSDERMWRKTRSPNAGSNCVGTDPNRNFDNHWGLGGDGPCTELYPGTGPNSEPEVKAFTDFVFAETSITAYVAVHSYGKYMLYPWGWTTEVTPDNNELNRVGQLAADAILAVRNTEYTVGTAAGVLYTSFGTSDDWAYGVGIPFSYTIELPSDCFLCGFDPPPASIGPIVNETWEAVKVFAANVPASRIPPPQ